MTPAAAGTIAADPSAPPLVLASASRSRREMLARAGVPVEAKASRVDEEEIKAAMKAEGADAFAVAEALAELKAQRISAQAPGALVIGADQMLVCAGQWFDKPEDLAHAAAHLQVLSGKTHAPDFRTIGLLRTMSP